MGQEDVSSRALGIVVKVAHTDNSINEVIEMGFDRLVIERSINAGLVWAEISIPGDRPVLEKDKVNYSWIDRAGGATYLYRTRYIITRTGVLSDASDSVDGAGLAVAGILTPAEMKQRYFFGVDFTDDQGNPLPDAVWEHYIFMAVEYLEHQLDIKILPTSYLERQDYWREEFEADGFISLDNYPVVSIASLKMKPNSTNVTVIPQSWIRLDAHKGIIELVPEGNTSLLVSGTGLFSPFGDGRRHYPHLWEIDYVAGFEEGKLPRNLLDIIGMVASLGPFDIFGDLIAGAGIGSLSLSMDGLSQSVSTTQSAMYGGYGSRTIEFQKKIKDQIPILRRYYKGVRMVVA